jgi:hypothetical protein
MYGSRGNIAIWTHTHQYHPRTTPVHVGYMLPTPSTGRPRDGGLALSWNACYPVSVTLSLISPYNGVERYQLFL